jgi:hypothetical protein
MHDDGDTTLSLGSTGSGVDGLHRQLAAAGFELDPSEIERAFFGNSTAQAVRSIQERHGLATTGIADSPVREALRSRVETPTAGADSVRELVVGRVVDDVAGQPVADVVVRAFALGNGQEGEKLGEDATNADGVFTLAVGDGSHRRALLIRVVDASGAERFADDVRLPLEDPRGLVLRIPQARVTLADAAAAAHVAIPETLREHLASAGIDTLADVLAAGGLAGRSDLPVAADDPSVRTLDALAGLSVLPADVETAARLANAGITSMVDVAATPVSTLVGTADGLLDHESAKRLSEAARAETRLVLNTLTQRRVRSNGGVASSAQAIEALTRTTCGCKECQEATSPLAYLADLLAYAIAHIRDGGSTIGAHFLGERFHQPFGELPAACPSLDRKVRQIRIAIEVLRAHLAVTTAPASYLLAAYELLLEQNGTSYAELRAARTAEPRDRLALGRRLGIRVPGHPQPNDPLDMLLLEEHAPPGPKALTEDALERLFGLQSTLGDPLRPDLVARCALYAFRHDALDGEWRAEDWPTSPPPDLPPIVDPDLLGPGDFRPPDDPATTNAAFELWQRRVGWVAGRIAAKDTERRQFSFDQMLGDQPVSGLNRATTVTELLKLKADQEAGTSIATDLQGLGLDQAGFDYVVRIAQLEKQGLPVLDSEWYEVFSILTQNEKRGQFQAWRAEERSRPAWMPATAVGDFPMILGPRTFRLRASAGQGGFPWHPTPWRSTWTDRRRWVRKLRARIERENAIQPGLQNAVDACEEATLAILRESLIFALPQPAGTTRWDWFTRRYQIDTHSDACRMTTRAEQAIETLQGVLFGARNGLLEDPRLTLEADAFDVEWTWIGSYVTWRAAMLVFLYPERALRPSLRRRQSPGFAHLLASARKGNGVDRAGAADTAAEYARYFADVCSLLPVAARRSGSAVPAPPGPQQQPRFRRRVVAIGQAAASGSYYFSTWDDLLQQSIFGGPPFRFSSTGETFWTKIEGLREASRPIGILAYQVAPGVPRTGLYLREQRLGAADRFFFTSHDGAAWSAPRELTTLPALVRLSETVGELPAAAPPAAGAGSWTSRADDRLVAADVDGDGAPEIVAIAASPGANGRRAVAVLREQDGGLVTSWTGFLPAGFNLPASGPVVLTTSSVNLNEHLLLVNPGMGTPPAPALGLLGWSGGGLTLISTSTTGWTVDPAAIFVSADLDANRVTELLAFSRRPTGQWFTPTATDAVVLTVSDAGFVLRTTQTLQSDRTAHTRSSGQLNFPEGVEVAVDRAIRIRGRSTGAVLRDEVLVTWVFNDYGFGGQGSSPDAVYNYVAVLAQDGPPASPLSARLYSNFIHDATGNLTWLWQPADQFVAWGEAIVVLGSAGIGVLRRNAQRDLVLSSMTAGALPSAGSGATAPAWTPAASDRLLTFDVDGDNADELLLVRGDASRIGVLGGRSDGSLEVRWSSTIVPVPDSDTAGWSLTSDTIYVAADLDGDGQDEIVAYGGPAGGGARTGLFRAIPRKAFPDDWPQMQRFGPVGVTQIAIEPKHSTPGAAAELTARRARIAAAYAANAQSDANRTYLDEAYYFVPVELALRLASSGDYVAALDWLSSVYDYVRAIPDRKIAYKLVGEESEDFLFQRVQSWLDDPLDPHSIAETRRGTYSRYTIVEIAKCLLGFADSEFTRLTAESVARAEELYLAALALLGDPELGERSIDCSDLIGELDVTVGDPEWVDSIIEIKNTLGAVRDLAKLKDAISSVQSALATNGQPLAARVANARRVAAEAAKEAPPATMETVVTETAEAVRTATRAMLAEPRLAGAAESLGREIAGGGLRGAAAFDFVDGVPRWLDRDGPMHLSGSFLPAPSFRFCIAPDPTTELLRRRAQLALKKIRSCRSISGLKTELEPYAQPTAAETAIERGDASAVIPAYDLQPLPYRYSTLVERAKQLVALAEQIEQSMISALEAGFLASYTEFLARQDLDLAVAGTRLKERQLVEAADGVSLAELQRDRSQMVRDHITDVMKQAKEDYETKLAVTEVEAAYYAIKGIVEAVMAIEDPQMAGQAFKDISSAAEKGADAYGQITSFEKAWKDYQYQGQIADQDIRLGDQQIAIARDSAAIAAEDHAISQLRVEQAGAVLDFLATKRFLTPDLYEWVAGVLQDVYRFFLQEATSTALLAERQLAFERQEVPPTFIQRDYWKPPADAAALARAHGDLKGLTGAQRLLRDLYALDQYAFRTDQRKLQLRKTISVSQLDPFAFERFRQTGVLRLATPSSLFDRERPGDYLRLVKRVRTSILALIPPGQGIQGTLATAGTSRVVIGDSFRTVVVQRGPEAVGLTKAIDSTGLLEPDAQSEMRAPFEGIGVDTTWQLTLPKPANPFDYETIADVLLTLEYTALTSADYRAQVIDELDPEVSGDRAFSFRHELQDQWFDLHNAAQGTGMTVKFRVEQNQFPPNVEPSTLEIHELALYYAPQNGAVPAAWATDLQSVLAFRADDGSAPFDGGTVAPVDGLISTLAGNAQSWSALRGKSPIGEWTLSLPDAAATRRIFEQEEARDVIFVITYGGELPPWPE